MLSSDSPPAWSAPRDALLRRLRQEGASWATIGAALAVPAETARERGRRIGAPRPPPAATTSRPEDRFRPPLPPGHRLSWGLLTDNTVLAGLPWPGWG